MWSCTNRPMARWSIALLRSPSVMLKAFAVPVRNASTLGKLNTPVPSAKFSLTKCRYSPPNFHRVPAARAAERVDDDIRRVDSSLREDARSAEVEIARHDHLRQADRTRDAISDVEVRRIERSRRKGATRRGGSGRIALRSASPGRTCAFR